MNIAFVGQKGVPARYGGVERHVEALGSRLAKRGHQIVVFTRHSYNNSRGVYKGMKIIPLTAIPEKHTEMISHTLLSLLNLVGKAIDVIHIHSTDPALLSFIPRMHTKVVVTSHGQAYRREKWGYIAKRFSRLAERAFVQFPHGRIAVSKILKKYYEEKYLCEVTYIPNGVDVRKVRDDSAISKWGLSRDDYLLFVGRIIPTKGCHTLINAFKKIKTDKKLVIVGGSSYSDEFFTKLKKSAHEKIIFLGYRYGNELAALYSNAYCCIVPSEVEGLAIALLEAMSYGNCVIYSDIPENIEAAHDFGIQFRNKDSDDLADKMKRALDNASYCKEIGIKARQMVQKEYDWDDIVLKTESVYRSLFL